MISWTKSELIKIGATEELQIAALRRNGTLRSPVTIWVIRLEDELYARSVNGRTSGWFRGVLMRHEGRIQAGGVERDVTFVDVADPGLNNQIDAAYRKKYHRYAASIINHITGSEARAATLELLPRSTV